MTPNNGIMWGTTATRIRRKRSNQHKAPLQKHLSLPELQLPAEDHSQFHCRRCGFVNTLIPLCIWCTWSSQEAEHAFEVFIPRARRVSSPSRAFHLELIPELRPLPKYTHAHDRTPLSSTSISLPQCHTRKLQIRPSSMKRKSRGLFDDTPSFVAHSIPEDTAASATKSDRDRKSHANNQMGTKEGHITGQPSLVLLRMDEDNVATATTSAYSYSASVCEEQEVLDPPLDSSPLLPSEETVLPGVDRSMTSSTPTRMPPPLLFIDLHNMKTDDDQLSNLVVFNDDNTKLAALSPRQQDMRSLRRKKHLNVLQTSPSALAARDPIPITLKLRSPTSKVSLKLRPVNATQETAYVHHDDSWALSQKVSPEIDSSSNSPVTPETPILLPVPPSTSPTGLSTKGSSSSPVRIGHPSRPYYSAIRKQGISPVSPTSSSSSRPPSIIASPAPSPRRQSYTPSTSTTLPVMNTAASRHLSTSTMFCLPAYSLPSENEFSVFSVLDDENADAEERAGAADGTQILPPTPRPSTTRFSFPRRAKDTHRISWGDSTHSSGSRSNVPQAQALSLSYSRRSGYRGSGVGFSMSGQTELRMALAAGATSAGIVEDGFRFRETAAVGPSALESDDNGGHGRLGFGDGGVRHRKGALDADAPDRNSFMGRVRKLRKGLRDMLLMTTSTNS